MKNFEKIFLEQYAILVSYAKSILGNQGAAEDMVQEVFLKLWNEKRLNDIVNPAAYLHISLKNKCIDYLRKETQNRDIRREIQHEAAAQPDAFHEEVDLAVELYREIDKLPPRCREIFILVKIHGFSYNQAAEHQNVSINMVKKQMRKALNLLRSRLLEKK